MALSDYEDALKSFIHDDDKLVTYKWLSKEFEIHVNLAKDILKQYWEKYKGKEKIVATLLLVGQLKDGSVRVAVVKESELNSVKQKFVKIDCEHLYSIQQTLPDVELLALVGEGDLHYSAIKCNEDYVRNDDEIESLRYVGNVRKEENKSAKTSTATTKVPEKPVPKKVELSPTEKSKQQNDKKEEVKDKEKPKEKEKGDSGVTVSQEKKKSPPNKSNGKASKKPVQSKQSGFNHLFGKVPNKPQTVAAKSDDSGKDKSNSPPSKSEKDEKLSAKESDTKPSKEKEKKNTTKEQEKEKKHTMKEQEKEKKNKIKEEKEKKNKIKEEKEKKELQEKENRHSQAEEKSKKDMKNADKVEKPQAKAKPEARGKKRNRSQEKNSLSKRKRIVVLDSSEDECDKSENDEEEEPMEVEEEPPKVTRKRSPSPPAEKRENGKRMVRKTIDKTFKDEEGFLVTKRVHVYEAVSDSEEPEVKEKEPPKPKPVEAPAKKKQTTLMNFFKKS